MKYYLVAGEASGDLHGSNLMKELKEIDHKAEFRYFGGDLMEKTGGKLIKHYREMAFMGILNVILNLRTIKRNLNLCKSDILLFKPDVLILIDYPGFNLRIAEFARLHKIRVFYFIAPKVWAWKENRIKKIKANVDKLFTILPFETEYFGKHGIDVFYVGNPLMDAISEFKEKAQKKDDFLKLNNLDNRPIVALLAGSRVQEIKNTLPEMLKSVKGISGFQFVIAGVNSVNMEIYTSCIQSYDARIIFNQTYDLLNNSHSALVASGTASLETALFNVPQAVLYRVEGGWLTHILMKNIFLKVKWVSLPNIILGRMIVKEFLQVEMKAKKIKPEILDILTNPEYRKKITDSYDQLRLLVGNPGCSRKAAIQMYELLK